MPDNISIGDLSGSNATDRLRETIVELDKSTRRQTRTMIWLTIVLTLLTVVIALGTVMLVVDIPR